MTLGELKSKIKTLGFEDDSTLEDYNEIIINACNFAMQTIFDDIVIQLKGYYKHELTDWTTDPVVEWEAVRPTYLTTSSPNTTTIELPDNLLELVPLLASYVVWLDDDVTKSTYYWNTFDQKRERIIMSCLKDVKGKIIGGIGW